MCEEPLTAKLLPKNNKQSVEKVDISEHSNLILIVLSLYFLSIVGFGLFYSRRAKSTEDFILAGHSLSTPFVTGSVVATWLGGAVILGGAREAYVGGFQAIIWDPWSPVLTLLISGFFLVRLFRRSRHTTTIDFYVARFDKRIGMIKLTFEVVALTSWVSAQFLHARFCHTGFCSPDGASLCLGRSGRPYGIY
jgi:Na+/proline symporter